MMLPEARGWSDSAVQAVDGETLDGLDKLNSQAVNTALYCSGCAAIKHLTLAQCVTFRINGLQGNSHLLVPTRCASRKRVNASGDWIL